MRRLLPITLSVLLLTFPAFSCSDDPSDPAGPENGPGEPYSHDRNPGVSAGDFLSDATYPDLVVEIDYMAGYDPDDRALESLQEFLEARLNKASVTILAPTQIAAGDQETYTAAEIRDLEGVHRDEYTAGDTLTAYMLIVDGRYEQGNVLGIAYYNTSSAFFGAAYEEVSGGLAQPSRYLTEATSFRHEYGHLLGLVGIPGSGTEMQTDHKDEANGNHCDNDQCLMYFAMESTDLFGSFFEGEIPALDQNCIDDLQAAGGK